MNPEIEPLLDDLSKVVRTPPPIYPPNTCIIGGDVNEVSDRLQEIVDLGGRHLQLVLLDYPDTEGIEFFLSDVLPRFKGAA